MAIIKGNAVKNATAYELVEKADGEYISKGTNTECRFDTDELDLADGDHTFVVKAKAEGFNDSPYSNEVVVSVAAKAQYYIRFSESAADSFNSLGMTAEMDGVATDIVGATAYYCNTCRISGYSRYGATVSGDCSVESDGDGSTNPNLNDFSYAIITLNGNVIVSDIWEK